MGDIDYGCIDKWMCARWMDESMDGGRPGNMDSVGVHGWCMIRRWMWGSIYNWSTSVLLIDAWKIDKCTHTYIRCVNACMHACMDGGCACGCQACDGCIRIHECVHTCMCVCMNSWWMRGQSAVGSVYGRWILNAGWMHLAWIHIHCDGYRL